MVFMGSQGVPKIQKYCPCFFNAYLYKKNALALCKFVTLNIIKKIGTFMDNFRK